MQIIIVQIACALVLECGYDIRLIGERMRQREREEMACGVRAVTPPQVAMARETPTKQAF